MKASNRHRILRQVLELDLTSVAKALELQETAAHLLREQALPEMESLFDRVAGTDKILHLERVEIDLGELRGSDWPIHFRTRLLDQLQNTLEQALAQSPNPSSQGEQAINRSVDVQLQQLLFFLDRGRLPWWGGKPENTLLEALPQQLTAEQWQTFGDLLRVNAGARQRLIYTVSDNFLGILFDTLYGLQDAQHLLALLTPAQLPPSMSRTWREQFWRLLLEFAVNGSYQPAAGQKLMQRLLEQRMDLLICKRNSESNTARPKMIRVENDEHKLPNLPQPWQNWLESVMHAHRTQKTSFTNNNFDQYKSKEQTSIGTSAQSASVINARDESTDEPESKQDAKSHFQSAKIQPDSTENKQDIPTQRNPLKQIKPTLVTEDNRFSNIENNEDPDSLLDYGEAVYLEGAGAVILHPFLEELFGSCDLLYERDFSDEYARQRAVLLLSYLSFGSEQVAEYDLLLPKLLCNLPWREPLPPAELSEAERLYCTQLLHAVLKHWTALKSDSLVWLREQFFLREGKLIRVDAGWTLTVERRAQDVLLDKLPWGVGLIHLPWMPDFLHVSWTT